MLKLKKSFSLFLCILFALIPTLSFSACKDDGFEIVQSITYTTTEGKKIMKNQGQTFVLLMHTISHLMKPLIIQLMTIIDLTI